MAAGGVTDSKRFGDTLVALESTNMQKVTDENGHDVEFGSLFKDTKAIIIFVRVSPSNCNCMYLVKFTRPFNSLQKNRLRQFI